MKLTRREFISLCAQSLITQSLKLRFKHADFNSNIAKFINRFLCGVATE